MDVCHSSGCLASNFLSYSTLVTLWDLPGSVALGVREIEGQSLLHCPGPSLQILMRVRGVGSCWGRWGSHSLLQQHLGHAASDARSARAPRLVLQPPVKHESPRQTREPPPHGLPHPPGVSTISWYSATSGHLAAVRQMSFQGRRALKEERVCPAVNRLIVTWLCCHNAQS